MRKGEKVILGIMAVGVLILGGIKVKGIVSQDEADPGIPFFSTADTELTNKAAKLLHDHKCKSCHFLWGTRELTQAVPAPPLDGEGSFRSREWLYNYFSAKVPQDILPTRLKVQYRQPSFADLPEEDRNVLADYMSSLKVEEWYFEETKKRRYEKLTGKDYVKTDE
ncbi:MAG: cytochrome c [Gammaproteobacteria bacterium]|nr:cytochrome c [Gammaproteobacteria bacterium]